MTSLVSLPRLAWLVVLLALVPGLACGGDESAGDAPAEGVSAAGEASDELFDSDYAQVCRGTGQPRAAAYTPGPGIHPVLTLRSDDGASFSTSIATLPDGWAAAWPDLERTELVVCAVRRSATPGRVCDGYKDDDTGVEWSVQLHDAVYDYTVRNAQTAEVLGEKSFEVPAGSCPMLSFFDDDEPSPQPYYPPVADGQVELFVRPFVTGA